MPQGSSSGLCTWRHFRSPGSGSASVRAARSRNGPRQSGFAESVASRRGRSPRLGWATGLYARWGPCPGGGAERPGPAPPASWGDARLEEEARGALGGRQHERRGNGRGPGPGGGPAAQGSPRPRDEEGGNVLDTPLSAGLLVPLRPSGSRESRSLPLLASLRAGLWCRPMDGGGGARARGCPTPGLKCFPSNTGLTRGVKGSLQRPPAPHTAAVGAKRRGNLALISAPERLPRPSASSLSHVETQEQPRHAATTPKLPDRPFPLE